jgi:hypothetical protein
MSVTSTTLGYVSLSVTTQEGAHSQRASLGVGSGAKDGHGPASPAAFPYWSVKGPQIGGLIVYRTAGTYRTPETKKIATTTMTNTATVRRLLTTRRYTGPGRSTMRVVDK